MGPCRLIASFLSKVIIHLAEEVNVYNRKIKKVESTKVLGKFRRRNATYYSIDDVHSELSLSTS